MDSGSIAGVLRNIPSSKPIGQLTHSISAEDRLLQQSLIGALEFTGSLLVATNVSTK